MNDKFDELAKGMAQSVTRRAALRKFGVGLVGVALASLGMANRAEAGPKPSACLPAGQICGSGRSMPVRCLNFCCSHSAYLRILDGGIYSWRCK